MSHSINVCFSTTDKRVSRVIRWFTSSEVSHCYLTFRDQTLDMVMILEADWQGFVLVPWDVKPFYGRELVARYSLQVPQHIQLEAIRHMCSYLGSGYNFMSLLPLAFKRFWRRADRPTKNTKKIICSESVIKFFNLCGVSSVEHPHNWTPHDVYDYVKSRSDVFKLEEEDL